MSGPRDGLVARPRTVLRKAPNVTEIWGPLQASWCIQLEGSMGSTQVGTYDRMRATVTYFLRDGRKCSVVRTESCPASGCNGKGTRSVRKRGHIFLAEVPCKGCRGQHDTVEEVPDPIARATDCSLELLLDACGLAIGWTDPLACEGLGRYQVVCKATGWPLCLGSEGTILVWLRETGRLL